MDKTSNFGVSLNSDTSSYHANCTMGRYSDRLAMMFGTFSDLLLAAGFKSDPRYVDMVHHWEMLESVRNADECSESYPWDELVPEVICGSGDHASVDTVYPKPAEPDVTGGFLCGDIVKVTSDAYVDSGRVLNMVGKVSGFAPEYARSTGQTAQVHFKEHSDMLFWLDPRALTLIYRA